MSEEKKIDLKGKMLTDDDLGQVSGGYSVSDECISCGACEATCPTGAIYINGYVYAINGNCIKCNKCINICPMKAIW